MANATPSRSGLVNNTGSNYTELFEIIFPGEILTTFNRAIKTFDKHFMQTIDHGKSARFPIVGKTTSGYHTPGTEITGDAIKHNEKIINVDGLAFSSVFIANIDDAMNHFEVRSRYAEQLGQSLAENMDEHILQTAVLSARGSAAISGDVGGTVLTNANFRTNGAALAQGHFLAAQTFEEKDITNVQNYSFMRPAQYYILAQATDLLNRDWGGAGSYSDAYIPRVAGIELVKTNSLPITDKSGDATTGENNTYNADFSDTACVIFSKEAVGTVKLRDMAVESEYDMRRQGTLVLAKYLCGHGILQPKCAIELAVA